MIRRIGWMALVLSLIFTAFAEPEISVQDLQTHVKYLASKDLEGRLSISPGAHKAADYIAGLFKKWKLQPKGTPPGSYFQDFEMTIGVMPGENNRMVILTLEGKSQEVLSQNLRPLAFTANQSLEAEAVFVGYGVSAPDQNYDEYAGLDVKGKIVVALRGVPDFGGQGNLLASWMNVRQKAKAAAEKGAVGFVLVNTPENDRLLPLSGRPGESPNLVAVNVTQAVGDQLLQPLGLTVAGVVKGIQQTHQPASRALEGVKISLTAEIKPRKGTARNVIGFLPGNDPKLKQEIIVIGAHYDHLGHGETGSLAPDSGAIHYGADDNASGTAGLLELAEKLASERRQLKRSVLFIAFSGEEEGLIGSDYFMKNPTAPREKMIAMINLDMIGRMKDKKITIGGVGSSPAWETLLNPLNTDRFEIAKDRSGMGPSDHTSFYKEKIPVLFFFTGTHEDYHRPSDTWEKINYEDQSKVTRMVYRVVKSLDTRPERIAFTPAESQIASQPGSPQGDRAARSGLRVRIGFIPDYSDQSGTGLLLNGVRPGSPAEKAGLKSGDKIIELGGKKVGSIEDLFEQMTKLTPGQPVKVKLLRNGQEMELSIVPEAGE